MDRQTLREIGQFIWRKRLYWAGLIVLLLLAIGVLLLATPAPLTPFVYTLF